MAGDWIKMRDNLWDDPRVSKIVDMTDSSEAAVIGALYWLWAMADQHTENGILPGLTLRSIDRKTSVPGFAEALCAIEWLADHPDGVRIIDFEKHNGSSAKKRCQTAKRVANSRSGNADVTPPSLQEDDTGVSDALAREEKRREEVIPSLSESAIPTCPHDELINIFAQQLPSLPLPNKGLWKKGKNAPALKARWHWVMTSCHESGSRKGERLATTSQDGLDWFSRFFGYVGKSAFLMGNSSDWACDLIWLVNASNFEKVLQGSYENKAMAA